ncbi:MAG: hypothetical protein ABFD50_16500 [Smithella sp.]
MQIVRLNPRPTCQEPGCNNPAAKISTNKNTGWITWRKKCGSCHNTQTAAKHGLRSIPEITAKRLGFNSVYEHLDFKAQQKGFKSYVHYTNSKHPYLRHRKDYCENVDGRLGFTCTTAIEWDGMLDVDHINGDPSDNREDNCQTLCKCCHAYKTWKEKDWLTPGRKAMGIKY